MWWCLSNPHRWAGNICGVFIFVYGVGTPYAKNIRGWSGFESARKNLKKLAKRCWHPARCMVLYLGAKRWDKRMTSESQLEVKRKEPIDVRKFRLAPRNRERSKFAREIWITKNFEKRAWQKITSVIKWTSCQPLGWGANRPLKIEQYRKTCNGTYFRVGKTR